MAERRLQDVIFYSLEAATKSYRRFAQARFDQAGLDITVDQWLVLKTLNDSPDLTLQQVGNAVFKDFASVTRIVQLLERKQYLHRKPHPTDGRRSELVLTRSGRAMIHRVEPITRANRRAALDGIGSGEVGRMREVLLRIIENCERGTTGGGRA
jgi:MarR family transcriptional regulator, transcriptional regulator for hemolysin